MALRWRILLAAVAAVRALPVVEIGADTYETATAGAGAAPH